MDLSPKGMALRKVEKQQVRISKTFSKQIIVNALQLKLKNMI